MKIINLNVLPDSNEGKLRNILGMNNSPAIRFGELNEQNEVRWFRELAPAFVRYHDAVQENSGYALIDVSRIFPLFHLDENDPRNYNFKPTDDYLSLVADIDVVIDYRLGETIEHSKNKYRVYPPENADKWARICRNILRHYLCGWADGMHLKNLKYVSVWEEPDNDPALFRSDFDAYLPLFVTTYRLLKEEFPFLKIGGPNATSTRYDCYEKMLAYCKAQNVEPDFVAMTAYADDPEEFVRRVQKLGDMTRANGWEKAELMITEWHLGWGEHMANYFGNTNAAFSAATLIRLHEKTDITAAYYYRWSQGNYTIFKKDPVNGTHPMPVYYGLKYFTETAKGTKLKVTGAEDVDVLAGVFDDTVRVLISCMEKEALTVNVSVPGYTHCICRSVSEKDWQRSERRRRAKRNTDGSFVLSAGDKTASVILAEFTK